MTMKPEEKEFLEENFKAGEYVTVTILVKNEDIDTLIGHLKSTNLNLAVLPHVQAGLDFANPNKKGTEQ